MTVKQTLIKAVYPALLAITRLTGKNTKVIYNQDAKAPVQSIYDLAFTASNGTTISLNNFKGQKMLLVNTASDCGYTPQYNELQQLHRQYGNKVAVLGFPANDFSEQEKATDEAIQSFCAINFGVTFPLAKKSVVIKKETQNEIYQWLTSKDKNGWNNEPPGWNFAKYLVNEEGVLTHYFEPSVSPAGAEVLKAIEA